MTRQFVRVQAEVFRPGAIARGAMTSVYLNPPDRFAWYPAPEWHLHPDHIEIQNSAVLLNFIAIGEEVDGVTAGDLDFLTTLQPVSEVFGASIPKLAEMAAKAVAPGETYGKWCRIALYDCDVTKYLARYVGLMHSA